MRLDRKRELRIWWREIDRVLLLLVLVLMAVGTLAVAAASPATAHRLSTADITLPDLYFFWAHIRWQMLGLMVLVATSLLPRELWRRGSILLAAGMLFLLFLVPIIGYEVNGAKRWIRFGLGVQPSEFLKPAFAITMAWILSWKMRDARLPVIGITGAIVGLITALLMLQPNLGAAVLFIGTWLVMVMLAGLPLQRIGMLVGGGMAGLLAAYLFYDNARHRIDAFFGGPTPFDHVDLANRTLTGGGWTGSGFWLGENKMRLPEAHTDYIFSVIGEELGLMVCAIVVILYLAILLRVLIRLMDEDRLFIILAASGLVAMFGGQAFINIMVNLQLFPSKGMTLPLVSYGGSSTIAQCFTIGLLLAVTRRNPYLARDKFDLRDTLEKGVPEKDLKA
ncbi:Cell division protein FtsW [Aurantiacibacter gangjinensis]|uniref:Probable peptidoglycan glycosyltransferase FtsW n=2 Tax=Aurantiacibacter gangjinensis TaxID=502682 RepID=A0A0G9MT64_9SPHN|nr:putative peptidoglycan glycosyltransferase FtsW [Aurantiacibacter gangjinensis]APE27008.1 Cell division protein FtsW [Aurantiacibacter gangjinensis]KLE33719.1 cell division protein FtsW [Aurantiacibacter gangjinensis]